MKLPTIDDKEIVPVRLIPIITNAWLGQSTLSGILANRLNAGGFPFDPDFDEVDVNAVHAYHLNADGISVKMLLAEWEGIYRDISLISPLLRKAEEKIGMHNAMAPARWLKATRSLPPGVFLWRNELDSLWEANMSYYSPSPKESPDFRTMNHDAYIRPEYRALVWEGFEPLMQTGGDQKPEPVVKTPPRKTNTVNPRTYTRHELADLLKIDQEVIFDMMTGKYVNPITRQPEIKLHPSIIRNIPTKMHKSGSAIQETHKGVFGIDGYQLACDKGGIAWVAFKDQSRVLLYKGGFTYVVSEPFEIHKDELVVTIDDLDDYRNQTKRQVKFPHDEPVQPPEDTTPLVEPEPLQAEDTPPFDVDAYVKSHRKAIECNHAACHTCKKHECRNQLAHTLFTNYGDHTPYRVHLWKIGVALGLPEPTWATDRDSQEQMKRQKGDISAIKSTVTRWKKAHPKKVTP